MEPRKERHKIRGNVQRITYRSPETGYSVIQVKDEERDEVVTVTGTSLDLELHSEVEAQGYFKVHPKFGRQLVSDVIRVIGMTTPDGIERYLSSGLIKGVGKKLAQRIVGEFGQETYEVLARDPERLAAVSGVGSRKATRISKMFADHSAFDEIVRFLVEHGVSPALAKQIHRRYGPRAMFVLNHDPYVLARDVRGVGFKKADQIALQGLKLSPDAPQRLKASLLYALERSTDDGHCFLPSWMVLERAQRLLGLSHSIDLSTHLADLIADRTLIDEDTRIYLPRLHSAELSVARFIGARARLLEEPYLDASLVETSIHSAEHALSLSFSEEQRSAVHDAARARLMVITGGPGCGKTTLIRALALLFRQAGMSLALAAPTGRAAQRMSQVCEFPASTIHRLLKFSEGSFTYGINEPLPHDALIIDEASMLDVQLACALFSAIPATTTLVLVGDKDQLPSVGPGRVFGDIIAVPQVRTVRLTRLYRRDSESTINSIAHTINQGELPIIPSPDGVTKCDAYFIEKRSPERATGVIEALVADQLPRKFGFSLSDIIVLTPSNRGPLGIEHLNERLQARLNGPDPTRDRHEITVQGVVFRVGDKVCQRVNNYSAIMLGARKRETEVYNGDTGVVHSVDPSERSLVVELWDGRQVLYSSETLQQLSLAYAMTVHRSQGTEIPCVVLALHESHNLLLQRQLVYTAVTRAKKLLVVVGSRRALAIASERAPTAERGTRLTERICLECSAQSELDSADGSPV